MEKNQVVDATTLCTYPRGARLFPDGNVGGDGKEGAQKTDAGTWPEGYVPRSELQKTVEQRQSLKKRADEAEARLAQLDQEAQERALAELEKGKQFDTAKAEIMKGKTEAEKRANELLAKYQNKLIETHLHEALAEADAYPEIRFHVQGLFRVNENDVVESLDGRPAKEIIKAKLAELPHLKKASTKGQGSGANGSHDTTSNPLQLEINKMQEELKEVAKGGPANEGKFNALLVQIKAKQRELLAQKAK